MAQRQSPRIGHSRQSRYAPVWVAYLLVCAGIVVAGAMLTLTDIGTSPVDLQAAQPKALESPVARIQSTPDRNDLCRILLFHNDSGRYQDGGMGKCIFPNDMLVWTIRGRGEAFADAFRSSWRGDPGAAASR
jgi:hypothetical protein